MKSAADQLRTVKDEIINTTISTDGSWQRRGFSSLNGVVTVNTFPNIIGNNYRVKTKNSHACKFWKGKKGPKADHFHKYHKCPLNHWFIRNDGVEWYRGVFLNHRLRSVNFDT